MNDQEPLAPPRPDEVHVWWIDLDRMDAAALAIMSEGEIARAERFRRQQDRERWIASRVALRQILARYVGAAPEMLQFALADRWRKPGLEGESRLRFGLTHAGDRAALAVAWDREVGIDMEPVDAGLDVAPLLAVACTAAERLRIEDLPPAEQVEAFLTLWILKEAYLKGIGAGLTREPRSIEIDVRSDGRAVVDDPATRASPRPWSLRSLDPGPGWAAALAVAGAAPTLHEFCWPVAQ